MQQSAKYIGIDLIPGGPNHCGGDLVKNRKEANKCIACETPKAGDAVVDGVSMTNVGSKPIVKASVGVIGAGGNSFGTGLNSPSPKPFVATRDNATPAKTKPDRDDGNDLKVGIEAGGFLFGMAALLSPAALSMSSGTAFLGSGLSFNGPTATPAITPAKPKVTHKTLSKPAVSLERFGAAAVAASEYVKLKDEDERLSRAIINKNIGIDLMPGGSNHCGGYLIFTHFHLQQNEMARKMPLLSWPYITAQVSMIWRHFIHQIVKHTSACSADAFTNFRLTEILHQSVTHRVVGFGGKGWIPTLEQCHVDTSPALGFQHKVCSYNQDHIQNKQRQSICFQVVSECSFQS
jgi:hypothetical protein